MAIGVVLVLLGLLLAFGGQVPVEINDNRLMRSGDGPRRMIAFGAAYAVASLSCTLAVLLVIGSTLASSSAILLPGLFAAYCAGASTILLLLTVSTALANRALERGLRGTTTASPARSWPCPVPT